MTIPLHVGKKNSNIKWQIFRISFPYFFWPQLSPSNPHPPPTSTTDRWHPCQKSVSDFLPLYHSLCERLRGKAGRVRFGTCPQAELVKVRAAAVVRLTQVVTATAGGLHFHQLETPAPTGAGHWCVGGAGTSWGENRPKHSDKNWCWTWGTEVLRSFT